MTATTLTAHERTFYLLPALRQIPAPAMSFTSIPAPGSEFEQILDVLGRLWNPLLHPRDRNGRFIRTFSRVTYRPKKRHDKAPTFRGDVLGFDQATGDARIRVTQVDDNYKEYGLKVGDIVQVPQKELETRLIKARLDSRTMTGGPGTQVNTVIANLKKLGFTTEADRVKAARDLANTDKPGSNQRAIDEFREIAEGIDRKKAQLVGVTDDEKAHLINIKDIKDSSTRAQLQELDNIVRSLATARHDLGDKTLPFQMDRGQASGNESERRLGVAKAQLDEQFAEHREYIDFRTGTKKPVEQVVPTRAIDQVYEREGENVLPELLPSLAQKIRQGITRAAAIRRTAMVAPGDRYHVDKHGDAVFAGSVVDVAAGKQGGSVRPAARMIARRIHTERDSETGEATKKLVYVRHFDPSYAKGYKDYRVTSKNMELASVDDQSQALQNLAVNGEIASDLLTSFSPQFIMAMRARYATKDAKGISRLGGNFFDTLPIDERVRADKYNSAVRHGDWVSLPNGELGIVSWISGSKNNMIRVQTPDGQPVATISPKNVVKMHATDAPGGDYVPTRQEAATAARKFGAEELAKVIEDPNSDHSAIKDAMAADSAFQEALKTTPELYASRDRALAAGRDPDGATKAQIAEFNKLAAASAGQFRAPNAPPPTPPTPPTPEDTTTPPGRAINQDETISEDGTRTNTATKAQIPGTGGTESGEEDTGLNHAAIAEMGKAGTFYKDFRRRAEALPEGPTKRVALNHADAIGRAIQNRDYENFAINLGRAIKSLNGGQHAKNLTGSPLRDFINRPRPSRLTGENVPWPQYFADFHAKTPNELFDNPVEATTGRPTPDADADIPISVDISNDEISKSLLEGGAVFFDKDGKPLTEGYAVQQKDTSASYPSVPTVDDIKGYLADHPFNDDDFLAVHIDPNDGGYRISRFSVFPAGEEGRDKANALAESSDVNQFIDISTGEVLNVSGPELASGDEPSPTDKSAERAVTPGDTPGTATVKKRTAKQTQVLQDLLNTDPDDAAKAAIQAALDGTPLNADQAKAINDHVANIADDALGGVTAQHRSGNKGVAAALADRIARATGSTEPRAYASRNTALRRSSDITSGIHRAMSPNTDEAIADTLQGARDSIKAGDYDAAATSFRDVADALEAAFPDQPQTARAAQRAREHADRMDRTTTGKGEQQVATIPETQEPSTTTAPESEVEAPTPAASSAADLFKDDGWEDLEPEERAALQRTLDDALAENPDLDLQTFRESIINGEEEEEAAPPPTGDTATQAADLFKDDGWDDLEPEEQIAIVRTLTEALEEDPDLDLQEFRRELVGSDEGETPTPSGEGEPSDISPAPGLKSGGLKKFAAAKAAEYALKDAADDKIKSEVAPLTEGEGEGTPAGEGAGTTGEITEPHSADPTHGEAENDLEDPTPETDAEADEAAAIADLLDKYPELEALADLVTKLDDETHELTRQQKRIIAAIKSGEDVVVRALAGTGKTSTLVAFAKRMEAGQRAIYLAFNKSVQEEAAKRFPSHVESRTVNSMAWRAMGDVFANRTEKGVTSPTDIFKMLGMRRFSTSDGETRSTGEMVDVVKSSLRSYMISGDDTLSLKHVDEGITDDGERAEVLGWAQAMWKDFTNPKGQFGFDQDALVKMWALRRPDFTKESSGIMVPLKKGDVILFDEAQDINDVLARVVRDNAMQTITVGDGHQSIYGWRGATDQLDKMNAHYDLPLTESWRFGNGVASWGNRALQGLGSDYRVIGRGPESTIHTPNTMTDMDAILARTNRGAMQAAIQMLEEGKSVGVSKKARHYLDQIVSTVGWLRDGEDKPEFDSKILNELRPYLSKGVGRNKVWLSPEDAWDAIVTAGTRERNPDMSVKRVLGIADKFSSDELQRILDNVKTVVSGKGDRPIDTTPDLFTNHNVFHKDNPLNLGDELNTYFSPDGKKLIFGGSTYRNREHIKGNQYGGKYVKWNAADKKWEIPIGNLNNAAYRQSLSTDLNALMNRIIPKIDVVISTAHLSKGLEWDKVRIWNDFKRRVNPDTGLPAEPTPEEKRLAYVALTRAIKELDPGSLEWVLNYSKAEEGEDLVGVPSENAPPPPPTPRAPTAPTAVTPDDIGGMDVPTMIEGIPGTKFDYTKVLSEFISGDKKSDWDTLTRAEKRAAVRQIISVTETGGPRHVTSADEFLSKHANGDLKSAAGRWADRDADWDPNEQRYLDADKAAGEGDATTAAPFTPTKGGLEGMAEIGNFYDKNRDIPSAESIAGAEAARGVIGWVTSNRAEAYFANWARRDASADDMRALFDRVLADPDFQGTTGSTWDILAKYHKEGTLPGAPEGGGGGTPPTPPGGGGEGGGGAAASSTAAALQRFRDGSSKPLTDEQAKQVVRDAAKFHPQIFMDRRNHVPATVDEFAETAALASGLVDALDKAGTPSGSTAISPEEGTFLGSWQRAAMVRSLYEFLENMHKAIRADSDALPASDIRPIMEALKERLDEFHAGSAADLSPVDKQAAMAARNHIRNTSLAAINSPERAADMIQAAVTVLDSELREPESADLSDRPYKIAELMGSVIDKTINKSLMDNTGRLHPTVLKALVESGALSRGLVGQSKMFTSDLSLHDWIAMQRYGGEGAPELPNTVVRTVTWSDDSTTFDTAHITDTRTGAVRTEGMSDEDYEGIVRYLAELRERRDASFDQGVSQITPNASRFLNNTFKDVGGVVARTNSNITEGDSPLAKWTQEEIAAGRTGVEPGGSDNRTHAETSAAFLKGVNSIVVSDYALSYTADEDSDWFGHVVPHELGHAMDSMVGEMLGPGSRYFSKVDPKFDAMYGAIMHASLMQPNTKAGQTLEYSLIDWYYRNEGLVQAAPHNGTKGTTEMFAQGYSAYAAAVKHAGDLGVDLNSGSTRDRTSRDAVFRRMGSTIMQRSPHVSQKQWDAARLAVGKQLFDYFDDFEKNVLPGMWEDGPTTVVHTTQGIGLGDTHGAPPRAPAAAPSTKPPANVVAQLKSIKRRDGTTLEFKKAPDRGTPEWDAWATQLKATHPTVSVPGAMYTHVVYNPDALIDSKQGVVWRGWSPGKNQSATAYSEHHKTSSLAEKHQRGTLVDKQVPIIIAAAKEGAAKGDPTAIMALMIASTGMRVSSSDNAGTIDRKTGKKIPTYGASSLMKKHVFFPSATMVRFKFLGKAGKENTYESRDPELIAAMRGLVEGKTGTQQIFPKTNSTHAINFFRDASGMDDILNHDLRTWFATDLARREIAKTPKSRIPKTPEAFKKERARIAKIVGDAINDGAAVADKNYIAPSVWRDWQLAAGVPPDIDEPEDLGEGEVTAENILLAAVPPADDATDDEDLTLLPPELFSPEAIAERAEWYASFMWPGEPKIAPPVDEDEEE